MLARFRSIVPAFMMLAGCAAQASDSPITGSTQGTTFVRYGEVTEVTKGPAPSARKITVRFENGDERAYSIEGGDAVRVGDSVKVTQSQGPTRITR